MVSPHGRVPGEIVELYKNATAPTATYKSVYLADASGDIAAGQRQADWKKFGKNLLLAAVAALIIFALMVAILFTV
nr:hypothetical protein [Arthrobacter sp. ok909]